MMDIGVARGLLTLVIFLAFLGIGVWSFSRKRQTEFDAAARMPLDDEDTAPSGSGREPRG